MYTPKRVSTVSEKGNYEAEGFNCYSDADVESAKLHFAIRSPKLKVVVYNQNDPFPLT